MSIELEVKNYRCFSDEAPARFVVKEGHTALVGTNNSGKSTFLKLFYELRSLFEEIGNPTAAFVRSTTQRANFSPARMVADNSALFFSGNPRPIELSITVSKETVETYPRSGQPLAVGCTIVIPRNTNQWESLFSTEDGRHRVQLQANNIDGNIFKTASGAPFIDVGLIIDACKVLADTVYFPAFRNAVNVGSNEDYYDIKVGEAFIRQWDDLKTSINNKAGNRAAITVTNTVRRLFGYKSLEINRSSNFQTLQLIIDGEPFQLNEVGSGVSQIIITLLTAAIRNPSLILIDEPELNLHPALQMDFLLSLGALSRYGVISSTHQYGLARSSAEDIYVLHKDGDSGTKMRLLESTPRLSQLLGELQYSGYSELGFEKILMVEGVSEIKTIQQLLRKLNSEQRILLLPLSGDNLINADRDFELSEIKRITTNVSVLIDSEKTNKDDELSPERKAFVETCVALGFAIHVLEYRATENYFTDRAIKVMKGEKYSALEPYQALKETEYGWSKAADNWRIASEMTLEEITGSDLGQFLQTL